MSGLFPRSRFPAAPENGDDPFRPEEGQILEDPLQGVVRVGVIDKNGGLPRRAHFFKPSRDLGQTGDPVPDGPSGDLDGSGRRRRGKDVVEIESSHQRGCDVERFVLDVQLRVDPPRRDERGLDGHRRDCRDR